MNNPAQKIIPHLWFDTQALEAAKFYTSLFDDSSIGATTRYGKEGFDIHRQPEGQIMTVEFELAGLRMIALNAGPVFSLNPSISLFVTCHSEQEVNRLWKKLSEGGKTLMPLDNYDWSEKYGWIEDRFGLTWQITIKTPDDNSRKITPCLMFVGKKGEAEAAINRYMSIFDNSTIIDMHRYGPGQDQPEGAVMHAHFKLDGMDFRAMDTDPAYAKFSFNEAFSLLIECDSQEEVDYYWDKFTSAEGSEEQPCGWLKDEFGISWQVCPAILQEMLMDSDQEIVDRVTKAFLEMKKFDISRLEEAFSQSV